MNALNLLSKNASFTVVLYWPAWYMFHLTVHDFCHFVTQSQHPFSTFGYYILVMFLWPDATRTGGKPKKDWRKASVIPICKKSKKDRGNYSPARLTLIPVKVMEQIILESWARGQENLQHGFTHDQLDSCLWQKDWPARWGDSIP